jgi:hypothetical protein
MQKKIMSRFDTNNSLNFRCSYLFYDILQEALAGAENMKLMIAEIFRQLLVFSKFACQPPPYGKLETKNISQIKGTMVSVYKKEVAVMGKVAITKCYYRYWNDKIIMFSIKLCAKEWGKLSGAFIYLFIYLFVCLQKRAEMNPCT